MPTVKNTLEKAGKDTNDFLRTHQELCLLEYYEEYIARWLGLVMLAPGMSRGAFVKNKSITDKI